MNSVMQQIRRAAGAVSALGLALAALPAFAAGTPAGTQISNVATVSYSVNGQVQTGVQSSPGGGQPAGTPTTFVVDRLVNFTLTAVDTQSIEVEPGQTNRVTTFLLTNSGNGTQSFALTPSQLTSGAVFGTTDTFDMGNLRVFVGTDATSAWSSGLSTGNAGDIPADQARRIFVVADAPATVANGAGANVQLQVRAATPGSTGATLVVASTGPDTASEQTVLATEVSGNSRTAQSGFVARTAALSIVKTATVVSDLVNLGNQPKAIPGATVEWAIVVTNNGTRPATGLGITDTIATTTTFAATGYASGNVEIVDGPSPRYCTAEVGPDANGDGCRINAGQLIVQPTAPINVGTGNGSNTATVRFRVTIN